ncbi:hypothetical protein AAHC03_0384 [Spirometra sp. Aus1]
MGAKLSCVSKAPPISGEKKPKKQKGKKVVLDGDVVEATADNQQQAAPTGENHVRKPVVFLSAAPADFKLPAAAPLLKKDKEGNYQPPIEANSCKPAADVHNLLTKPHTEQPVDSKARLLALDEAKPSCWANLYYHLITSRGLETDEAKVRAIFSWLCSKSPEEIPFPTPEAMDGPKSKKSKHDYPPDSPDVVLPKLAAGTANYVQAFESMCRYSGIPCVTVRGIAKSVDYKVGQPLLQPNEPLFHPETGALPPLISGLQHSWNAACLDGTWYLFDCTWAAQRLALRSPNMTTTPSANSVTAKAAATLQYETDMFYYKVDPRELIYTHYPFEDCWQLLNPPVSIVNFAEWPLVKPAFFQYGLSFLSHQEGYIPAETNLVVKLKMQPESVGKLMFTYQLNLEGFGNIDSGANQTRFGIHEVSPEEACVIFHFRLPKKGEYNLVIYTRHTGEQLFSDVCEYRVSSKGGEGPVALPFPPTAQTSYGPTEKAVEYGLETLPRQLHPFLKSPKGFVELRFIASEPDGKIPRLTARLRSVSVKAEEMEDCILLRDIEASLPTTGVSVLTGTGPCVPMSVLNAYLPEPGEYALEVYAAPTDTDEPTAYHLVWQFLIEASSSKPLSAILRSRLATMKLGPQDSTWEKMGFRTYSHPDPVVRVRTAGRAGSERLLLKATSKAQVLQRFMGSAGAVNGGVTGDEGENAGEGAEGESVAAQGDGNETAAAITEEDEKIDPEAADLCITLGLPDKQKICLISQLVSISDDEELDVTGYLLQKSPEVLEPDELLPGDRTSKGTSLGLSLEQPSQLINLLVRIPKSGSFYKLYLYAVPMEEDILGSIPLIYTYLIEAPYRMTAAETPYIGVIAGEFPEKIEKRKAAEQQAAQKA